MWLEVNGKRFQNGNTRTMVFGVAQLVSYLSRFMTLYPGDLITHRHAARRRPGHEAAAVPEAGRRDAAGHRRAGRAAASACMPGTPR